MNITNPKLEVHHINSDGLNNQRSNLQTLTRPQHRRTMFGNKISSSRFKGVYWKKQNKKWCARIRINNRLKHLGYFDNEKEAALVYNTAAKKYFKEFAKLNFIVKE